MSCVNCLNLKVGCFTYNELKNKWDDIYFPTSITEGYRNRFLKESLKQEKTMEMTRLKFVYCTKGMLTRFYIIRGTSIIKAKAGIQDCQFYL